MNKFATICIVTGMVSSLGGCASPLTKVTDVTKDKEAYLVKDFSPDKLSPDVSGPLKHTPPIELPYKTLTFDVSANMHKVNSTTGQDNDIHETQVYRIENAGDGFVRVLDESSSNDIPFGSTFSLEYLNFLLLSSQYVGYSGQYANPPGNITKITRVDGDLSDPKPDSSYEVDEVVAGVDHSFACKSGKLHPAKDILPKLQGEVLDLDCAFSKQGILQVKSKMVFLQQYTTYIVAETDNTTYTNTFKITDITAN